MWAIIDCYSLIARKFKDGAGNKMTRWILRHVERACQNAAIPLNLSEARSGPSPLEHPTGQWSLPAPATGKTACQPALMTPADVLVTTIGTMLRNVWTYLCVGAGGAMGTMLRFWISGVVAQAYGERFPTGTLVINITGSFVIGLFATLTGPDGRMMAGPLPRQFFMIGICGGYTTFSSFSLQNAQPGARRPMGYAALNIGLSVALCLIGVWLGFSPAKP